jgi:hypothetical protein
MAMAAEMQAMEQQMEQEQVEAEQFQEVEENVNMQNSVVNSKAQFSNGLADSMKSAAK